MIWHDEFNGKLPSEPQTCYSTQLPVCQDLPWGTRAYSCAEAGIATRLAKLNKCNWSIWEFYFYNNAFHSESVTLTPEGYLSLATRYVPENIGKACGTDFANVNCPYLSGGVENHAKPASNITGIRLFDHQRVEIRAKLPAGNTWPGLWLMPENNHGIGWPQSGELDIVERFGNQEKIQGTLHSGDGIHHYQTAVNFTSIGNPFSNAFHVYAVEWDSPHIRFYFDDQVQTITDGVTQTRGCTLISNGAACSNISVKFPDSIKDGFYILMNTAHWPSANVSETGPDDAYSPLLVDYVRVFAKSTVLSDRCSMGGTLSASPNCLVYAFGANVLRTDVSYWVDADPRWPGVYYLKVNGQCPYGGVSSGPNCQIHRFGTDEVKTGVAYWVATDPRWPGVYYKSTVALK